MDDNGVLVLTKNEGFWGKDKSLRQSKGAFRTVAEFANDCEFWFGINDEFLFCTPSCQRVLGHSTAVFENDPSLLRALVHPDDLAAYDQHRQMAKEQRAAQEIEFRIIRADGSIRWIWVAHVCQPVYDESGQFLGTRESCRDITERKRLEAEEIRARNLASLGILAGGIAHDFNNLFQGLFGNLALAKMNTDKSSKAFPFLENAENVFSLATKLTNQLIAFSTGGVAVLVTIQPSPYIRQETISLLGGSGVTAEFVFPDNLWSINVDPGQFREVIKQMVLNAKDAMSSASDGKITIEAANEIVQGTDQRKCATISPGNYVRISIQDQGNGIKSENFPRIFDPYFSTKSPGCQKGMGLGLALCDTIVRKHGGAISVDTKLNKGTTFHVFIPAVVPVVQKIEMAPELDEGQGPRILFMDDEPGVVQVMKNYLKFASGFRIDSVMDGDSAVNAVQEAHRAGAPYAVVVLDLTIPGGRGAKDVVSIIKTVDPEVKVIVSSGYTGDDAMVNFANYGFDAACAKPYQLVRMKELVERLVG